MITSPPYGMPLDRVLRALRRVLVDEGTCWLLLDGTPVEAEGWTVGDVTDVGHHERLHRLAEWRRLLRQSTTQGRAVLQRVVDGRITFTPNGGGYTFEASTRFDKLFSGVACELPCWVNPEDNSGKEHLTPEDTFDGDYGRLLERAYDGKGLASHSTPSWNQLAEWFQQVQDLERSGLFASERA